MSHVALLQVLDVQSPLCSHRYSGIILSLTYFLALISQWLNIFIISNFVTTFYTFLSQLMRKK